MPKPTSRRLAAAARRQSRSVGLPPRPRPRARLRCQPRRRRRCSPSIKPSSNSTVRRPGRLLDLGCGTGRLLLAMAQRGWWTLGVDLSPEMLRVAADKAVSARVVIHRAAPGQHRRTGLSLADGEFRLLSPVCSARSAWCWDEQQRRRVVGHAFRVLRPGGRFILHVHNRWFNVWDRQAGPGCCATGCGAAGKRRSRHAGASGHRRSDAASVHAPRGVPAC